MIAKRSVGGWQYCPECGGVMDASFTKRKCRRCGFTQTKERTQADYDHEREERKRKARHGGLIRTPRG